MTQDITSLIEKLKGAEVGSRELDDYVWIAATNGEMMDWWDDKAQQHQIKAKDGSKVNVTPITTSLDAALALAERLVGGKEALLLLTGLLTREADASDFDLITVSDLPRLFCAAILRAQSEAR